MTQDNQGKKTAGIDGVKSVGPMVRLLMVERLRVTQTLGARPVRRVFIPKLGKDEQRPLGIPVMLDRAHQALAKLVLEPQWEARFEPNSYGFRPGRSCHDAIVAIYSTVCHQAKFVLDADIKGCFDHIDHQALLRKLDTIPAIRRAVKGWLKAGIMTDGVFTPTTSGTPQGGVASPLLANIALHGMEEVVERSYQRRKGKNIVHPRLIRYADDLVVLDPSLEGIMAAQAALEHWLAGMGLHLSPNKTRITHTLHPYEGRVGFDFLGYTIRQFPVGAARSGTNTNGALLGFKTHTAPSKEAIKRHTVQVGDLIRRYRGAPQAVLISKLNPVVWGWTAYYRMAVASSVFSACDSHMFAQLFSWARVRHQHRGRRWIAARYWNMQPGAKWLFVVKEHGEITHRLRLHRETPIRRHIKVRGHASPYDGNLRYWARRLTDHPLLDGTLGRLLAYQRGKCPYCGLTFTDESLIEIDHRVPTSQGGHDTLANKQALHRHCHDQKSAQDADGHP